MTTAEPQALDVMIVTGMSGAGRSTAADVLEDLGFFVIDNLPPALISKVAELAAAKEGPSRFALGVDVRAGEFMDDLAAALAELRETGARTQVLFLDASDEVLVRRFVTTRRKHPLAETDRVSEGIARERELLEELKGQADMAIDTSNLNVHDLRDRLREMFAGAEPDGGLQTSVVSFGYKHGLPLDVDLVFDCRFLPNPHWVDELRPLAGTDPKVRRYVMNQADTEAFLDELDRLFALLLPAYVREGKSYLSIGVGCTGGRHRSVVIADELGELLERQGFHARVPPGSRSCLTTAPGGSSSPEGSAADRARYDPRPPGTRRGTRPVTPQPRGERSRARIDAPGAAVVALGGGHGLAVDVARRAATRGLITAVVSVADDGGSSGTPATRLRRACAG